MSRVRLRGGRPDDAAAAAARLHDRALYLARLRGCGRLALWVLEANLGARRMYENRGWRLIEGRTLANDPPTVLDVRYELDVARGDHGPARKLPVERFPVVAPLTLRAEDPRADDVQALLATHLAFSQEVTPAEDVHALDLVGLLDSAVTVFAARRAGRLLGVGALRQLDDTHAELKSMHTAETARGQGVGRAMVEHLLSVARGRGCTRVSLETGTMEAFAPARALYVAMGFEPCEPFGNYRSVPGSVCMTIDLGG